MFITLSVLIGVAASAAIWALPDSLRATKASAVVTVFAVVVAAVYAWFTYGLWEETAAETRHNRDTFVSENRPYVYARVDAAFFIDKNDIRTATSLRVYLKNAGKSPANVLQCFVDAKYLGGIIGRFDLGSASMGLFPGQEQPINRLLELDAARGPLASTLATSRGSASDPVTLEVHLDYTMDTTPAVPVRYITTQIIELTKAGQFLAHQVLTSEPIAQAPGQNV